MGVDHKGEYFPVLLDKDDFYLVKSFNKIWKIGKYGTVYCEHSYNGSSKDVPIHELIMNNKYGDESLDKPIIHINRINLDNRKENLIYDTACKKINKNLKKKKRTINISNVSDVDSIPTYVWYMKKNGYHGDRFVVSIPGTDIWKTTSSKNVSTSDKLNMAKEHVEFIKNAHPDIYYSCSINGELNDHGHKLLNNFYDIVYSYGYVNINKKIKNI